MEISPMSDRSVAEEEEQAFVGSPSRRKKRALSARRAALRPWAMGIGLTVLVAVAAVGAYTLGASIGSWNDRPSTAATPTVHPAPMPSVSSEPPMSGGYEIGPDGVLVRPAQFAADTYTKPELPEAAKENSERGAEAAAEHYLALLVYAWNTGDTTPFEEMSAGDSQFALEVTQRIRSLYDEGWLYNDSSIVEHVLKLEPAEASDGDGADNSVAVVLAINSTDGTICQKKNIYVREQQYHSIFALVLTWDDGRWVVTRAGMEKTDD
ncbi:DUF6318 family protein [Schaalia odontolytica]|jgi:hypothetical protein|nr:DUF6318 family protein [Actinomyces sp. ICM54]EWC97145.1 hypothetical protein HMPREF1522_1129 [Actinomyces sp. ICM54]MCQ5271548.1 DUF6318 family protein [Schaalia odontolytica]